MRKKIYIILLLIILNFKSSMIFAHSTVPDGGYTLFDACCIIAFTPIEAVSRYFRARETETFEVQGAKIKVFKQSIGRYYDIQGTPFKDGSLVNDTVIPVGKIKIKFCKDERIEFYPDGTLLAGTPCQEIEQDIKNIKLKFYPVKTYFNKNGIILKGFIKDKIELPVGEKNILFSNDYISFYDDGKVLAGRPVSYNYKSKSGTFFFENNNTVVFEHDGSVKYAFNSKPNYIKETEGGTGLYVSDYRPDKIFKGIRYKDSIQETYFSEVSFFPDKQIQFCNLVYNYCLRLKIKGTLYQLTSNNKYGNEEMIRHFDYLNVNVPDSRWKESISFFPDGSIEKAYFSKSQTITVGKRQIAFTGNDRRGDSHSLRFMIYFYADGSVKQGALEYNQFLPTGKGLLKFCGAKEHEGDLERTIVEFKSNGLVSMGTVIKKYIKNDNYYFNPQEPGRAYLSDGYYYEKYTDNNQLKE